MERRRRSAAVEGGFTVGERGLDAFVVGAVGIVSLRAAALADLRRVDDPADVATTRPHLAAAMLRLANPRIGEVVVDVACGAGTLVKEAVTHSFSRAREIVLLLRAVRILARRLFRLGSRSGAT